VFAIAVVVTTGYLYASQSGLTPTVSEIASAVSDATKPQHAHIDVTHWARINGKDAIKDAMTEIARLGARAAANDAKKATLIHDYIVSIADNDDALTLLGAQRPGQSSRSHKRPTGFWSTARQSATTMSRNLTPWRKR
jgi:hypothetical protein